MYRNDAVVALDTSHLADLLIDWLYNPVIVLDPGCQPEGDAQWPGEAAAWVACQLGICAGGGGRGGEALGADEEREHLGETWAIFSSAPGVTCEPVL